MRLDGKVALITGGASGMGASMARVFAGEGAKVSVADMLEDEGKKLVDEITRANGAAIFQRLDVTSETEWQAAIAATLTAFGKLDILVNDAGISGSAVDDLFDTAAWQRLSAGDGAKGPRLYDWARLEHRGGAAGFRCALLLRRSPQFFRAINAKFFMETDGGI